MKSIQINRYGGSDVIEVKNAASVSTPSLGKILVNVKAAGVNPADRLIQGLNRETKYTDKPQPCSTVAQEHFAELDLVDKDGIAHKPKTLNHIEAAGLLTVGISAWQGFVENIGLSKYKKDSNSWWHRRTKLLMHLTTKEIYIRGAKWL